MRLVFAMALCLLNMIVPQRLALRIMPITASNLMTSANMTYVGAFRLPNQDGSCTHNGTDGGDPTFDYSGNNGSGNAITYDDSDDTLLITANSNTDYIAKLSIPTPISGAADVNDLNCAAMVSSGFIDMLVGHHGDLNTADNVGPYNARGLTISGSRILMNMEVPYDGSCAQQHTTYVMSKNFSSPSYTGLYTISGGPGHIAGPMSHIPSAWQSALGGDTLTGDMPTSIITCTGVGPSLASFTASAVGVTQPAPSTILTFYEPGDEVGDPSPDKQGCCSDGTLMTGGHMTLGPNRSSGYNGVSSLGNALGGGTLANEQTNYAGSVFPDFGTANRTVLVFEQLQRGASCYGHGVTTDPYNGLPALPPYFDGGISDWICYAPFQASAHGYNTLYQSGNIPTDFHVLAYDVNDLIAVKNGSQQVYDPYPYAHWTLHPDFEALDTSNHKMQGVAYSASRQWLFVETTSSNGFNGRRPMIQVYSLTSPSPSPEPIGHLTGRRR